MSGVKIKTIKGGKERAIVLKRLLIKLEHCDEASAFAGSAEMNRIHSLTKEEFLNEFNTSFKELQDIYKLEISSFISPCGYLIGTRHLKELVQRLPKRLTGWVGLGIKVVYNVKKKRGQGIEIR